MTSAYVIARRLGRASWSQHQDLGGIHCSCRLLDHTVVCRMLQRLEAWPLVAKA